MEKLKSTKNFLCIIIAIIIIVGVIIGKVKGFNIELLYQNRESIVISNNTSLDKSKLKEIAKGVLGDKKFIVQEIERFGNYMEIISSSISEEEKQNLVTKINEEMGLELVADNVGINKIPATRIRDILKPYVLPGIVSIVIVLVYFAIVYNKIGLSKLLLKAILIPVIAEVTYYSIIAITRIPFGRVVNAIALGVYVLTIGALTIYFQKSKENLTEGEVK